MNLRHCLGVEHVEDHVCGLLEIVVVLACLDFLHKNDVLLINSRDEVLRLSRKETANGLKRIDILLVLGLDQEYHSLHIRLDVEFLCTVVNINEQEVIKKKVLDEVVFVEALLVCDEEVLDLECCQLSYHIYVITSATCEKDVFELMLVKHLEKLISLYHLAVCRGIHKGENGALILLRIRECGSQHFSLCIADAEINSGNTL